MEVSSSLKQLIFCPTTRTHARTHTHNPITLPLLRAYAYARGNKVYITMYNVKNVINLYVVQMRLLHMQDRQDSNKLAIELFQFSCPFFHLESSKTRMFKLALC